MSGREDGRSWADGDGEQPAGRGGSAASATSASGGVGARASDPEASDLDAQANAGGGGLGAGGPPGEEEDVERALGLCMRELDRRERTAAQLRGRLERAGTGAGTIAAALGWLSERGLVDDAGYAERFTHDRRVLDGWGDERIRGRLEAVGLERELIDGALGGREAGAELAAAAAVLARRMGGATGDDRERRRALGLLARRGYPLEVAHEAVRARFGPSGD
jgi:regulatory protein